MFKQLIVIGFTLSLMVLSQALIAADEKKPPEKSRATPVVVSEAKEIFLAPTILVPGTIVAQQQSELPAEVEGRLTWVADVGAHLKKGDPVARLDDTLYRLRAGENKATLNREKVRLEYLDKEVVRLEELTKSDFSSKNALDKVILDRDVARSEVVVAEAKVKVDEETLARYVVRAPFDGVVVDRLRREGEWINGGDTVVTLSNPDQLEVDSRVNEKSIKFIRPGDKLMVQQGNEKVMGVVRAIVPVGDAQSHLFDIRIDITHVSAMAGQVVRVQVPLGEAKKVLSIPRDALVLRRDGTSIFRVSAENKAEKLSISTGIASGDFIEVIGPLNAGDKIVVRGSERLRPGQDVNIIPGGA